MCYLRGFVAPSGSDLDFCRVGRCPDPLATGPSLQNRRCRPRREGSEGEGEWKTMTTRVVTPQGGRWQTTLALPIGFWEEGAKQEGPKLQGARIGEAWVQRARNQASFGPGGAFVCRFGLL